MLASGTVTPPSGAGALRLTLPVSEFPPVTAVESKVSDATWFDVVNDHVKSADNDTPSVDFTLAVAFPPLMTPVYVAGLLKVELGVNVAVFEELE